MYNLIGAVYSQPVSQSGGAIAADFSNVSLNASGWTPITFVSIDAANNVGMSSNNDGIIINNSGSTVEINGSFSLHAIQNFIDDIRLLVGVSPDGLAWNPAPANYIDINQRLNGYISGTFEYKVDVPNGHRVALLGRTSALSGDLSIYSAWHHAYSTQGAVVPKLNAACSTFINNSNSEGTTNSTTYTVASHIVTIEGSETAGSTTNNSTRITNTTGETLIVDGAMNFVKRGVGFVGFNINWSWWPHKNGVPIQDAAWKRSFPTASRISGSESGTGFNLEFFANYTVELLDGEYVELFNKNNSGGTYATRTIHFQHTMRSRT